MAAKDAHLFLWTTEPCLRQAFDVIKAWGFRYSAVVFTWVWPNWDAWGDETDKFEPAA